jgi:integrase
MDDGSPMTYPSLEWGMKSASTKAGLRGEGVTAPTLHSLRHGFGSMLIAEGRDVVFVSRQMGHASSRITLDIYAHEFGKCEAGAAMATAPESRFGALL